MYFIIDNFVPYRTVCAVNAFNSLQLGTHLYREITFQKTGVFKKYYDCNFGDIFTWRYRPWTFLFRFSFYIVNLT